MASGLFALLDDIAAIAKVAAASIDDTAVQALKAGKTAVGVVIDDAAVTPRYVVGFAADRELPIVAKIAWGSLKNKLVFLLPAALLLSVAAPWAITPLLMAGGAFLCFEGWEKVHHMMHPPLAEHHESGHSGKPSPELSPAAVKALEDAKVASAIRTDFVLSAEIMAISLGTITAPTFMAKAVILGVVGLMVTVLVYGAVALIVKADDFGVHLAKNGRQEFVRRAGRAIVAGMPGFLKGLSFVGMLAMLWVGGGIVLHGLEEFGLGAVPHGIHGLAVAVGGVFGPLGGFMTWLVDSTIAGVLGLGLGWLVAKVVTAVKR